MTSALILKYVLVVLLSYLLGSLNFSIIFSKLLAKKDIRESGSGNAGATNMLRTYGKRFAVITMIGDILKVAAPMKYLFAIPESAQEIRQIMLYKEFAGFFAALGHIFPVFFKFKGGKGMAACTGMVILVDWRIALILFVIFVLVIAVSKWVSLGSIVIAVFYPVLIIAFYQDWLLCVVALLFTIIVIVAHRENIKRLIKGTENKISLSSSSKKKRR